MTTGYFLRNNATHLLVDDTVTHIPSELFHGSNQLFSGDDKLKLVQVDLSQGSVMIIDHGVFQGCASVREVHLCDGLEMIGAHAFAYCSSLKCINIPSTVRIISNSAFEGCTSLTEVILNEGLTCIKYEAFENCRSLKSIALPSTATRICRGAFLNCTTSLSKIHLNEGIQSLGDPGIFDNCWALKFTAIPSTVTEIGEMVVHRCASLSH